MDGIKREPDESSLFTIKDPFDEMHNPGRVGTTYKNKTMQCFDTAVEVLKSKNVRNIESLFEWKWWSLINLNEKEFNKLDLKGHKLMFF